MFGRIIFIILVGLLVAVLFHICICTSMCHPIGVYILNSITGVIDYVKALTIK